MTSPCETTLFRVWLALALVPHASMLHFQLAGATFGIASVYLASAKENIIQIPTPTRPPSRKLQF